RIPLQRHRLLRVRPARQRLPERMDLCQSHRQQRVTHDPPQFGRRMRQPAHAEFQRLRNMFVELHLFSLSPIARKRRLGILIARDAGSAMFTGLSSHRNLIAFPLIRDFLFYAYLIATLSGFACFPSTVTVTSTSPCPARLLGSDRLS